MFFGFIFSRILFLAAMVFVIGYVFGNFSRNRALTMLSRIATVLVIVLIFASSFFALRFRRWNPQEAAHRYGCYHDAGDSARQAVPRPER
jgi:hypothetical protein